MSFELEKDPMAFGLMSTSGFLLLFCSRAYMICL